MILRNVLVLIADGTTDLHGDVFVPSALVVSSSPVPVTDNFNRKHSLGTATLRLDGPLLWADITLKRQGVIWVKDETRKGLPVVPAIAGVIQERRDGKVSRIQITEIALTTRNVDHRVPALEWKSTLSFGIRLRVARINCDENQVLREECSCVARCQSHEHSLIAPVEMPCRDFASEVKAFLAQGWRNTCEEEFTDDLTFDLSLPLSAHDKIEHAQGTLARFWPRESLLSLFDQASHDSRTS